MFGVSDPNKLETAENTADVVVKVLRGIDVAIDNFFNFLMFFYLTTHSTHF